MHANPRPCDPATLRPCDPATLRPCDPATPQARTKDTATQHQYMAITAFKKICM